MENKCKFVPRGQLLAVLVVFCSVLTTVHRNQKIYASFLQRNCFTIQAVFINFVHNFSVLRISQLESDINICCKRNSKSADVP